MQKRKYFNKPQIRSMMISAPFEVLVAGRGTGKTIGVLATKSAQKYLKTMPRGTGAIINATFTQAYTRTLKELIRGWQNLGYIMDHHFIVGKRPSDKWIKQWRWKGPFAPPIEYKHFVVWYNGAVAQLISQERPGSANGTSLDWLLGDEIKLLNHEKLTTEIFPANRGIVPDFAGNPYHHGWTFTTDMPVGSNARWILDYADKMDQSRLQEIMDCLKVQYDLKVLHKKTRAASDRYRIEKLIEDIQLELTDLRQGFLYYHEASTLDNIHALGIDYINQQLRDTSIFQFETQILNLKPLRLEDGFYPDFDEEYHGYFSEDSSYFDNAEIDHTNPELDCRKDKDLKPNLPLHISLDYNRRIHPLEVAQVDEADKEIRAINGMQVLYPLKLKDIIKEFNRYYKPHKANKSLVYYWFDHTAVGDQHETRICDDVVNGLRKEGWTVVPMYLGNSGVTATHEARYRMWGKLLTEDGSYPYKFRINRENCNKTILSIQQAPAEKRKDGFGKNKKSEQDPKFPADESTHHSEALDLLLWGILESKIPFSTTTETKDRIIM